MAAKGGGADNSEEEAVINRGVVRLGCKNGVQTEVGQLRQSTRTAHVRFQHASRQSFAETNDLG